MRPAASILAFVALASALAGEEDARPAKAIQDNSFFVEEAYNQEPGVVQHIFNLSRSDEREVALLFVQEWPVFSQAHQFSYSLPWSHVSNGGESANGLEDVLLNYRFQALTETRTRPAFAPRLSLILPTGAEDEGFGNDTLGYQTNLPVSKIVSDRFSLHGNAGATLLPDVQGRDLFNYNLGASAIDAVSPRFNLMVEAVGNWDEEIDDAGRGERKLAAILSPGARYAFNFENDAQLVLGIAAPIGVTSAAPDFGVLFYLSFEHFFER